MKAKELMIGDWVHFPNMNGRVAELKDQFCEFKPLSHATYDLVDPIPLTAEILEKNGFMRGEIFPSKFYRNIDNEQIMFCPYSCCYDIEYVHWNESNEADVTHRLDVQQPMNYVHELQHALRLCGLDELADNFKV